MMSYLYIKQKGKFPWDLHGVNRTYIHLYWENKTYKLKRCIGIEKAAHSIQVFINVFVILYRGKLQWTRKLNAPADHSQ